MSNIQFDTPANRVIAQQQPKNKFRIDTSLPDITFLRQLSVQGRLRFFQQDLTADPISIVPPTGETFFFYRAQVFNRSTTNSTVIISNDGIDRWNQILLSVSFPVTWTIDFIDSLVGDGTKAFTMTSSASLVRASLFGWVENTSRIRDVTS